VADGLAHREALEGVRRWHVVCEELLRVRVGRGMSTREEEQTLAELDQALNLMRAERVALESEIAEEDRRAQARELLGRRRTA
jgi:hypothetical protein